MGTVGYKRRVSFTTAFRMGRASISASVGTSVLVMEGRCSRISSRSWVCQSGFVARSQTAHVKALLVVSCLQHKSVLEDFESEEEGGRGGITQQPKKSTSDPLTRRH